MKRAKKWFGGILCVLALLFSVNLTSFAAADAPYYDCVLFLYGFDDSKAVTRQCAIQVRAGDGSNDIWAITSYQVTSNATQYLATDPTNVDANSYAELIAGDAASGIAVFRLANQIAGRTVVTLRTLGGLASNDVVAVAGLYEDTESMYFFTRPAYIQGLQTQNGYSRLTLSDADNPLSELNILPIAAIMTTPNEVVGFYTSSYSALPSGYVMKNVDGIGSLETSEEQEPSTPSEDGTEEESQTERYTVETMQGNTGVEDLLRQAEAERNRAKNMKLILITVTVAVTIGLIVFALLHSEKQAHTKTAFHEPAEPMGKTEYVGTEDEAKTPPARAQFSIVPLNGTPGSERQIPPQGLTFGRSPNCDVIFAPDTGGVSGRHCLLFWKDNNLCLKDLESSYGTLLQDGHKLVGEETVLRDGDRFYLGSHNIGFQITEIH